MKYGKYGKVRAVFEPKSLETLKPAAKQFIGEEGVFDVLWLITEEDSTLFSGCWAMGVPREWAERFSRDGDWVHDYFSWVPNCDLRILEVIEPGWS